MSIGEILAIDLPTIIVLVVVWLLDFFKIRGVDKKLDDMKGRMGLSGSSSSR